MNLAINLISNGDKLSIQFPKLGKKLLKQNQSGSSNLVLLDHQLLKNNRTLGIEKMNSKEIYSIIISSKVNIPTSRIYFEKKIPRYNFQWRDIYTLPRKVTINAYLRSFQYKILNNILYLNKKLHNFGLPNTQLCSFCKMKEKTISHLFNYFIFLFKISGIKFRFTSLIVFLFHS